MKYTVKVHTKSSINKVEKIDDNTLKIYTTATPSNGEANNKILKLLAEYFQIGKTNIKITKGQFGNNKIIEVNH